MSIKDRIEDNLLAVDYNRASVRQLSDLHAVKALVTRYLCRQYLQGVR